MRPISTAEAQAFDRRAQEKLGIPSIILMENAGRSVAEEAIKMVRGKIAVICGTGNNGGDGMVAARHLLNAGIRTKVYLIGDPKKLKPDPKTNYAILKSMGQKILSEPKAFTAVDLIIDAIFGIGLSSEVREPYRSVIDRINRSGVPVLAVDVPSGLDADTGKVLGTAVKADITVTFVAPKKGFSKTRGPEYCGKIVVRDIGIV